MKLRYHALARQEVIETAAYYGNLRPELGMEFLAELDATVALIESNPM